MAILTSEKVVFKDAVLGDLEVSSNRTTFQVPTCIGKDMQLEITFKSTEALYDVVLYYNFALFAFSRTLPENRTERPDSYFKIPIDGGKGAHTVFAEFVGDETQRNYKLKAHVYPDRKTLVITHTFYVTADIGRFLEERQLENRDRLLKSHFLSDRDGDFLGIDSVYNQNEDYPKGMKVFVRTEAPDSFYDIWVKSDRVTVRRRDGGSFLTDGYVNGGDTALFKQTEIGSYDSIVNGYPRPIANVTASTMDIMGNPAISQTDEYVKAWGLKIFGNVNRTFGTGLIDVSVWYDWYKFKADFYNQGKFNYHSFSVQGKEDMNFDLNNPNNLVVQFTYDGGTVDWVDFWLSKKTNVINTVAFLEALGNNPNGLGSARSIQNIGGNLWEAVWDMKNTKLEKDELYHVVAVFNNKANSEVGSLISPEFGVDDLPSVLAIPAIKGSFRDYKREYQTDALNVHYYDRYNAILRIDKKSYERLLTDQGGSFDDNINYIKVAFYGDTYRVVNKGNRRYSQSGNLDYGIAVITDTDEYLTVAFDFRVMPNINVSTQSLNWEIGFSSEPDTIYYQQKVAIQDYDSSFFTDFELRDLQNNPISTFYNQNGIKAFGQITNDGLIYILMAVIDDGGRIREWEEEPQTYTQIKQRQDLDSNGLTIFSDVSQQFDGLQEGGFTFQHSNLDSDSHVVMIAKLKEGIQEGIDYWTIEDDFIVQ